MEIRVRLLVNKVILYGFTWDDLENYLSMKKSTLIEEIKKFFEDKENSKLKMKYIFHKIDQNERIRKSNQRVVFER